MDDKQIYLTTLEMVRDKIALARQSGEWERYLELLQIEKNLIKILGGV